MMPRAQKIFNQTDLKRALKAVRAAGLEVTRTDILPDGTIRLTHTANEEQDSVLAFDRWKGKT